MRQTENHALASYDELGLSLNVPKILHFGDFFEIVGIHTTEQDFSSFLLNEEFSPLTTFSLSSFNGFKCSQEGKNFLSICSLNHFFLIDVYSDEFVEYFFENYLKETFIIPTNKNDLTKLSSILDISQLNIPSEKQQKEIAEETISLLPYFSNIDVISSFIVRRNYFIRAPSSFNILSFREFQKSEFVNLRQLGLGGYGNVSLCFHLQTGKLVAIKNIRNLKQFNREMKAYQNLKNRCILKCFGHIEPSSLVLEFMSNGSIKDVLQKAQNNKLDENHKKSGSHFILNDTLKTKIITEVLFGIDYLHSLGIMHRDIKPDNILIDIDFHSYISDFDSAREYLSQKKRSNDVGTISYMSPEQVMSNEYSFQTDLYSFGLLIYELASGEPPFEDGLSLFQLISKIKNGDVPKLSSIEYGPIIQIYEMCTSVNIEKRVGSFYLLDFLSDQELFFMNADKKEVIQLIEKLRMEQNKPDEKRGDICFIKEQAKSGSIVSQFYLALMYLNGKGVPQNLQKSFEIMTKLAEENGNSDAQFNLAVMYYEGKGVKAPNYDEALRLYKKSAKQGNPNAQFNLGQIFRKEKNYKKAIKLFNKAAKQGDNDSMYNLGVMYQKGEGVQQDYQKSFHFLSKSAERNDPSAQYFLGELLLKGEGVKQDKNKAIEFVKKAAYQGHSEAQTLLAFIYLDEKNFEEAYNLFSTITKKDENNAFALYSLAEMFLKGEYVEKSTEKAKYFLYKSANLDYLSALRKIGFLHLVNEKEKNIETAYTYFQKAANTGDILSNQIIELLKNGAKEILFKKENSMEFSFITGLCYFCGIGIATDKEKGMNLISEAATKGYKEAIELLNLI